MWYYACTMIRMHGHEQIESFSPTEVFHAGIQTQNWPEREGLIIKPQDDIVRLDSRINVGMKAAGISITLDGFVTELAPDEIIRIEGESKLAWASVMIGLDRDMDACGTRIDYEVNVEGRKLVVRMAEAAIRDFLQTAVPRFASDYRQNVATYLQAPTVDRA